jgi:hypothetical protein
MKKSTPDEILAFDAAKRGDMPAVVHLLDQGVDVNARDMRDIPSNVTLLMCAEASGKEDFVRGLIEQLKEIMRWKLQFFAGRMQLGVIAQRPGQRQ